MVMCLNEVTLMGHLGKDPEVASMRSGDGVVKFSLATTDVWKDQAGARQERTEWHNIVIFNKGAVTLARRFLRKGSAVWLRGRIQTRKWQDNAGHDRWSTEVVLTQVQGELKLIDKGQDQAARWHGQARGGAGGAGSGGAGPDLDDDVPF